MRTWGLDLATSPQRTGLVSIDWGKAGRVVEYGAVHRKRLALAERIADSIRATDSRTTDYWAVDVPFGWPSGFAEFLAAHAKGPTDIGSTGGSPGEDRSPPWGSLSHRRTDIYARQSLPGRGFNVSFDKLGATAAAWSTIEHELHDRGISLDRSGLDPASRIVETWPAAAWQVWAPELPAPAQCEWPAMHERLGDLLQVDAESQQRLSHDGHARDALVCALVARAFALKRAIGPPDDEREAARTEGWIYLPQADCALESLGAR